MTTFVRYHVETKQFTELARTADQLRAWLVFGFLCNVPDVEEVAAFAVETGLCSFDEFDSYFSDYQEKEELARHPLFAHQLPRALVLDGANEYSGDFPVGEDDLRRYCAFEVLGQVDIQAPHVPPWFGRANKPKVFQRLLSSNDQQGAWFCLNSSGWRSWEMKSAIHQLASASRIEGLVLLADWLSHSVPDETLY